MLINKRRRKKDITPSLLEVNLIKKKQKKKETTKLIFLENCKRVNQLGYFGEELRLGGRI